MVPCAFGFTTIWIQNIFWYDDTSIKFVSVYIVASVAAPSSSLTYSEVIVVYKGFGWNELRTVSSEHKHIYLPQNCTFSQTLAVQRPANHIWWPRWLHTCVTLASKSGEAWEKKNRVVPPNIIISKCHFILFTNLDFKRIPHAKYVEHSTQTIRHLKSMNVGQYNSIPSIDRAMWRRVWRLSDMNIIVAYRSCSYSFIIVSALDLLLQNCRHEPHTSFITANLIALAHIITTNKCQALPILPN